MHGVSITKTALSNIEIIIFFLLYSSTFIFRIKIKPNIKGTNSIKIIPMLSKIMLSAISVNPNAPFAIL